jgi:hypothetical protein
MTVGGANRRRKADGIQAKKMSSNCSVKSNDRHPSWTLGPKDRSLMAGQDMISTALADVLTRNKWESIGI